MTIRFSRCRRLGAVLALVLLASAPAAAEEVGPRKPTDASRCPVCGMLVARHPDWLAQIVLAEDEVLFFDGAKDLFRFLLDPEDRPGAARARESGVAFVTSYYDREAIHARDALFVIGSDVLGPMGAELIPHASREEAEEFRRDHGGSAILGFHEVTREILVRLD